MSRRPIVFLLLALAACARPTSNAANTPTPSPTPLVTATPKPLPTISNGIPTSVPTPTPAAVPSVVLVPRPVTTADPLPQIKDVMLSEHIVHSGDVVLERVTASPNTASIESRIGGYSLSLPKIGVGLFEVSYKVPFIPFFMHGKYQMVVIARNTAGRQVRRSVPILVQ
jgi:hypothetical protein